MDFLNEVRTKIKKGNKVLFSKNSLYLQELDGLLKKQNRKAVILWAFEFAEETACELSKKYPGEIRFREALDICKLWMSGDIKMPEAKRAILSCHAFAREINSPEDIALCHALGQACSVVHTPGHAMGLPIYGLTALVHRYGADNCAKHVEIRKNQYIERLYYWSKNYINYTGKWADFIK